MLRKLNSKKLGCVYPISYLKINSINSRDLIKGLFERALLQKLQLWFSSFTIKQLQQIVKVSSRSVWLVYGLQLL
jgi:hypothetical protein